MNENAKMNEGKPGAAELLACNERMRARVADIAHLANECLLNTNHPTGYEQGQYGKDNRTYGKAMSEILKLVEESMEQLEDKGEAASSPLVEKAEIPSPTSGEDAASPLAGADKDAKTADWFRRHWTFCDGLFPISFVNTPEGSMERCTINGRRFKASVTQEDQTDATTWNGYIYDNGKCVCMVAGMGKGKGCVAAMTHAAFKAYVKNLAGAGKYHNKGGFLKINAKRALAAKQQAHDNKAAATTHS